MKISISETYQVYQGKIPKFKRIKPVDQIIPFTAFDTESYEDGKLLCIAIHDRWQVWNHEQKISFYDIMQFCRDSKFNIFFCWNLDYDATVILKLLRNDLDEFYANDFNKFKFGCFTITYIKSKVLKISDTDQKKIFYFYDISQFFGKRKLDTMSKWYLGDQKKYDGKYQNKIFPKNIKGDELTSIAAYCMKDAYLTKALAELWINTFYKNFNTFPDQYSSPATVAYHLLQTRMTPNLFEDIPLSVQKLGSHAFFGGRFELFYRGRFENVYHYDINSAYPYAMFLIPDLSKGEWKKITKQNHSLIQSDFGIVKIKVKINEKFICPFPFRLAKGGMVYFPRGEFTTFVTLKELKSALVNYDIKLIDIEGYYFDGDQKSELGDLVQKMYYTRKAQKEEIQRFVYKVMINAIYGKIAQTRPFPSPIYNPVLSTLITGYSRSMLLDAMSQVKDDVIHVATDSIFSTKKLNLPVGPDLGQWSEEKLNFMIQFSNGIYTFENDQNKKFTKTRGFVLRIEGEDGQDRFLNLNDCKIKVDPKTGLYFIESKVLRYKTLRRAIIEKNYDAIAKFNMEKKQIDLNSDRKRLWPQKLVNLNSKQRSYPLNVDWLK